MSNESGKLYVVATPIGNLEDLSPRAVKTLGDVDLILAEDTRHSRKLLRTFSISTPVRSCHEHNEKQRLHGLLETLAQGANVALISDAGTPLVNDPGFRLVSAAHAQGIPVVPVPGPSACISALSVSGLPSDRFIFCGYPPARSAARLRFFKDFVNQAATLIFYEAPHRIHNTLKDAMDVFGDDRPAALAREMTKVHEEVYRDGLRACLDWLQEKPGRGRGEFVLLIAGSETVETDEAEALRVLDVLLDELPRKNAVDLAARITGRKKNELYRMSLKPEE